MAKSEHSIRGFLRSIGFRDVSDGWPGEVWFRDYPYHFVVFSGDDPCGYTDGNTATVAELVVDLLDAAAAEANTEHLSESIADYIHSHVS